MEHLSDRELEVFTRIGRGEATREIARSLDLSVNTIASYRAQLKVKLNLSSGAELVRHATSGSRPGGCAELRRYHGFRHARHGGFRHPKNHGFPVIPRASVRGHIHGIQTRGPTIGTTFGSDRNAAPISIPADAAREIPSIPPAAVAPSATLSR